MQGHHWLRVGTLGRWTGEFLDVRSQSLAGSGAGANIAHSTAHPGAAAGIGRVALDESSVQGHQSVIWCLRAMEGTPEAARGRAGGAHSSAQRRSAVPASPAPRLCAPPPQPAVPWPSKAHVPRAPAMPAPSQTLTADGGQSGLDCGMYNLYTMVRSLLPRLRLCHECIAILALGQYSLGQYFREQKHL